MPHVSFLFWMEYLLWRCGCGGVVAGLKQGGIHCFIWETICINAVNLRIVLAIMGLIIRTVSAVFRLPDGLFGL